MDYKIKDIAEELGLSRNTVAKVINGKSGVSPKTEQLVLQKIQRMNLKNATHANNLTSDENTQNGSILLLTKTSINYSNFWISVMRGIEKILHIHRYNLILGIMDNHDIETLHFPKLLYSADIKGVILVELCDNRICDAVLKFNLPTCTIDMPRNYEHILGRIDIVTMENKLRIKQLVNSLIKKGLTKFAFAGTLTGENVGRGFQERYDALCEALHENNLSIMKEECLLDSADKMFLQSSLLIGKIRTFKEMPQAFICGNDWTAIQLENALKISGFQIPEDVSIIGFDNTEESKQVDPPLTTIDTPKKYLGIAAAECILNRIAHPTIPYQYAQYMTDLIIRKSTK